MSTTYPDQNPASQNPTSQTQNAADPQNPQGENPEGEEAFEEKNNQFLFFQVMPSWLSSFILHIVLIILLALLYIPRQEKKEVRIKSATPAQNPTDQPDLAEPLDLSSDSPLEVTDVTEDVVEELDDAPPLMENDLPEMAPIDIASTLDIGPAIPDSINAGSNPVDGRSGENRARLVREAGGSAESEEAVALALKWLAAHQLPDGSWSFDHRQGPGKHRTSPNPGRNVRAKNGATAIALLPFLGAGQTHLKGEYKEVVAKGLSWLIKNQRPEGNAGSFFEPSGTMYSHGLAAICLCEAYAMTGDSKLKFPAQKALDYIDYAQDPVGGGWRYAPKMPGDTSVVGWQLMACKSGLMKDLHVPARVFKRAEKFLDSVSEESGAYYGYQTPGKFRGTTSVGLLCRMYMGWERENPALERGVAFLGSGGPSARKERNKYRANMYYNYYATQVMRHYGGEEWKKWNAVMRDFLVDTQSRKGNSAGSWYFIGDHGSDNGGRLYCTAMATMTLEVYYRHLPIYQKKSTEIEYELD